MSEDNVQVWEVRDGAGRPLMRFSDVPGPIIGTKGMPVDSKANRHPFLTVLFLHVGSEPRLRELLSSVGSPTDFLACLRAEGYSVVAFDD